MKFLNSFYSLFAALLLSGGSTGLVWADVRLPRLVSDGLVLQCNQPIHLWGWADSGEAVQVRIGGQQVSTTARNGKWRVGLKALPAGGPYQIQIQGKNRVVVNDVLIGDVWITAGQSNMELSLEELRGRYPGVIESTQLPDIREFNVPTAYNFVAPQADFKEGQWKAAVPEHLAGFSAAGFFFARSLHQRYHIPIGLVSIALGGSPAEAWISEDALKAYPAYLRQSAPFKDPAYLEQVRTAEQHASSEWYAALDRRDAGIAGRWSDGATGESDWQNLQLPGYLQEQGNRLAYGVVWLRKQIDVTEAQLRQPATLLLGAVVDADRTYLNGVEVGSTSNLYVGRRYAIPPGVLKAGRNTLVLRVVSYSGHPGFVPDKEYALNFGQDSISLTGNWQYKIGVLERAAPPETTWFQWLPYGLFNAKLAPCLPLRIKGVIWYQGEANTSRADEYRRLFPLLIHNWRERFGQGDFPFLFVQLAGYKEIQSQPQESEWAQLREAQRLSQKVKNTGMAVTSDIGEWNDIHPKNKQAVGERLALQARRLAYHEAVQASGPQPLSLQRQGRILAIGFDAAGGALQAAPDGRVLQLAIAGPDRHYVWAESRLKGNQLFVWSADVDMPVHVRYAWADNPQGANLSNGTGLPATPFEMHLSP